MAAAQEGHRTGSVVEILVLQVVDHHARGDMPAAVAGPEEALRPAEPEGYVRVFVDEGAPMTALLRAAAHHGRGCDYARRLLAADTARPRPRRCNEAWSSR